MLYLKKDVDIMSLKKYGFKPKYDAETGELLYMHYDEKERSYYNNEEYDVELIVIEPRKIKETKYEKKFFGLVTKGVNIVYYSYGLLYKDWPKKCQLVADIIYKLTKDGLLEYKKMKEGS